MRERHIPEQARRDLGPLLAEMAAAEVRVDVVVVDDEPVLVLGRVAGPALLERLRVEHSLRWALVEHMLHKASVFEDTLARVQRSASGLSTGRDVVAYLRAQRQARGLPVALELAERLRRNSRPEILVDP